MMRQLVKSLIFTMLLLVFSVAMAKVVRGLYSAAVPVANRSASVRHDAIIKGLRQVLVKVSGNSAVDSLTNTPGVTSNLQDYVREYGYQKSNEESDRQKLMLQISFDHHLVNQLLAKATQPIWPKNRPLVLVWMVNQTKSDSHYINDDSTSESLAILEQNAARRGVPLLFPVYDLSDLSTVSQASLMQFDLSPVLKASTRYAPDAILMVTLNQQKKTIVGKWMLLLQGEKMQWETDAENLSDVIQAGMDDVTDALAHYYAVLENRAEQQQLTMTVTELRGVSDYAHMLRYLRHLAGVSNIEIDDVSSTAVTFRFNLKTTVAGLQRTIRLDGRLKPVIALGVGDSMVKGLRYRYVRNSK